MEKIIREMGPRSLLLPAAMAQNIQDKPVFIFHGERFQLPVVF